MGLLNVRTLRRESDTLAIPLSVAKAHCFIVEDDTTQDEILTDYILSAQSIIENDPTVPYCFFTKQFEATFEQNKTRILLPKSPTVSVEKVEILQYGVWREIPTDKYILELGDTHDFVVLPYTDNGEKRKIRIAFTAGKDNADDIRRDIKQAVAGLVAHLFEYRNSSSSQQLFNNNIYQSIIRRLKRISY